MSREPEGARSRWLRDQGAPSVGRGSALVVAAADKRTAADLRNYDST